MTSPQTITSKTPNKLHNNLLLLVLFGIALQFFGVLYEGLVYGPKLLDTSLDRMLFWKSFFSVISPLIYYVPLVYIATLLLLVLYFKTPKQNPQLKKTIAKASIFQLVALALTIYIIAQLNFKAAFSNLETYAAIIPQKVILFNILSVIRIAFAAAALSYTFKAYLQTQKIN